MKSSALVAILVASNFLAASAYADTQVLCRSLFQTVENQFLLNQPKPSHDESKLDVWRNRMINVYTELSKASGRSASEDEVAQALGLTSETMKNAFGDGGLFKDFSDMKDAAVKKKPKAFAKVIDLSIFSEARLQKLNEAILKRQRLIVTTAVADTPVNKDFFNSLLVAARDMDAEILVFAANMQTTGLDPILLETPGVHIVTNTMLLSPTLALNNIKIMAKHINPLVGIERMGPREQSQIVGSPKLHLRTIPTIDNDFNPRMDTTTAAVTEPIYNGKLYVQERTNAIAAEDHVLGALLVEKSLGTIDTPFPGDANVTGFYHFRHITYSKTARGFTDISKFYSADGVKPAEILALSLPDIHVGEIDPQFIQSLKTVIKRLKPRRLALHDLFNGHSVSHHERGRIISSAIRYKNGTMNLEDELRSAAIFLNSLLSLDPKLEVRIVQSNHDMWLNRWLEEGQFMKEPHNAQLGLELAYVMSQGKSPLEHALIKFGLEYPKRVVFLEEGSWKEAGFELGQHGHVGANGARGSLNTMVRATDKSVFGHSHVTQRRKNVINIGTATVLRQGYNRLGPSSWTQSFTATSSTGETQLFVLRNGEWWAQTPVEPGAEFFPRGYPVAVPNNLPGVGMQVDQYGSR